MAPKAASYLIAWTIYVNDHDQETFYEGPYTSREAAEAAGKDRWKQIDPWHDAGWSLVRVYPVGRFPAAVRTVEPADA